MSPKANQKKRVVSALRFVQYDQLNLKSTLFQGACKNNDLICLIEPWQILSQRPHHKKKVLLILASMRCFAKQLKSQGWQVRYYELKSSWQENKDFESQSLVGLLKEYECDRAIVQNPEDYYQKDFWNTLITSQNLSITFLENNLFLTTKQEFSHWALNRRELTMEYFYRINRKKWSILMDKDKPVGGQWNYDKDNQKKAPRTLPLIQPFRAQYSPYQSSQIQQVKKLIDKVFPNYYGSIDDFHFALCQDQALKSLEYFIENHLTHFGIHQDIMMQDNPWLYHSHISFSLNIGLLEPLICLQKAQVAYEKNHAPLNSVEGFIRQILGWREFIRGIYHLKMPGYDQQNFFNFTRELPRFFWDGQTNMNCLQQSFEQTSTQAYAHHIQRLMVIGNFSLLAQINPQHVDNWFAVVYADAHTWVHTPNVLGMSLFADGGLFATKPYVSSGSYIHKMSNYCQNCHFNVLEKTGEKACPFNYLYWNFLINEQDKLRHNPRMRMIYSTLDKMSDERKREIRQSAEKFLGDINKG